MLLVEMIPFDLLLKITTKIQKYNKGGILR